MVFTVTALAEGDTRNIWPQPSAFSLLLVRKQPKKKPIPSFYVRDTCSRSYFDSIDSRYNI